MQQQTLHTHVLGGGVAVEAVAVVVFGLNAAVELSSHPPHPPPPLLLLIGCPLFSVPHLLHPNPHTRTGSVLTSLSAKD